MTKVVYNNCYGGFGLSRKAVILGQKLANDPNWCGNSLARTDSILVAVVEQLGKKANGKHASLAIEEVPKGTAYRIDEYDGYESVKINSDYDWDIA